MSTKRPPLDFDLLLSNGPKTYDSDVGHWWKMRSLDAPHARAYRSIAAFCASLPLAPKRPVILDYACGGGILLRQLHQAIPHARFVGLDGSQTLLSDVSQMLPGLVSQVPNAQIFAAGKTPVVVTQTILPHFRLPANGADLVVLAFPNLIPDPANLQEFNRHGYAHTKDNEVARMLARFREMDPEDETVTTPAEDLFDELMTAKVYSRHLRHLVRKGGWVVRVEYSQAPREELSELTRMRCLFGEGALETAIKEQRSEAIFRFQGSVFHKSKVILDVFHQTGDEGDKRGGYSISWFQAL